MRIAGGVPLAASSDVNSTLLTRLPGQIGDGQEGSFRIIPKGKAVRFIRLSREDGRDTGITARPLGQCGESQGLRIHDDPRRLRLYGPLL